MPTTTTDSSRVPLLRQATVTPAEGRRIYAQLRKDVIRAGILDRDYRYYAILTAIITAGIGVSLFYIVRLPVSPWLVLWSLIFSFFAVQICGIVHDSGHRAIFRSPAVNDVAGEISSFFLAMGYHAWRIRHNVHHAHTNEEGEDPDLDIPFHSFTLKRFEGQTGVLRHIARYQAFIFYPLRLLVVFSRRLSSINYFRSRPRNLRLAVEIGLWLVGIAAWFVAPFVLFPLAKAILLFVIVHTTMGFYLSNVFAPNHKGMPQFEQGVEVSFLEQQITTSRNITPGWLTDFAYIGLNYQIEHHLFPNCPRSKLKRITPYIRAICRETGLPYTETGIIESNKIIVATLNGVAKAAG